MEMTPRRIAILVGLFVTMAATAVVAWNSWVVVDPTERGVYVVLGERQEEPLTPGFHWVKFWGDVYKMNVQEQKAASITQAVSSDLQSVNTQVSVNYRPKFSEVGHIYETFGLEAKIWEDKKLLRLINESLKSNTAAYSAENLIQRRQEVKTRITEQLTTFFDDAGFRVVDVAIEDFKFSREFEQAIEAKMTMEQDAKKEQHRLAKVEFEAQQETARKLEEAKQIEAIATAEANATKKRAEADAHAVEVNAKAESDAQALFAKSATDKGIALRWMEAWDGKLPTITGTDAQMFLPAEMLKDKSGK